ncbi:MAG: 3-isopropylmalate dehydrogenase, partial [Gammaproteobacteria bacterium]|nr:3-isopropylmalate dehydrogenase [Gammaproteobacteria bacterium]
MRARIAVLAGDGIGPEVAAEGVRCLEAVATLFGHELDLTPAPFGGAAIDECGTPLPEATLAACRDSDAVLLGAIGGPRWSAPERQARPESGL